VFVGDILKEMRQNHRTESAVRADIAELNRMLSGNNHFH
jgi:hypothetical protein